MTVEGFSFPTYSPRNVFSYFHLLSVLCLCCSTATTTYVFDLLRPYFVIDSYVQYVANKVLEINERNTWTNPDRIPLSDPQRELKLASQDEEIFQTARLINCTWFANIVFSDYFSCILGLVRQGNTWSLNPFGVRGSFLSFCSNCRL